MNKTAQKNKNRVDYRRMDDDRRWLMAQNLSEYAGQWIAVYGKAIIARGKNLKNVMNVAERGNAREHPLYLRIPEGTITS